MERLQQPLPQPFFFAAGFVRPHLPHYAPAKWFDLIGKEQDIQPPPILKGDMDDLPKAAWTMALGGNREYLQQIQQSSGLQAYVPAYLACIAFVDHQISRLLDALESSPYAKNTVIVLWSDHGYHLGEKEIVMKFTPRQRSSRVPRLESPLL